MKDKLKTALKEAMKSKDKLRLETIRGLMSAIQYEEIAKKVDDLPAEACLGIFQSEHKKRKESIEFAVQAKRDDLIEKLNQEIAIIESFLPKQMSAAELEKFIVELKEKTPGCNLGVAMKALKESFPGQYDSKLASEVARKLLV